MVTTAVTWRGIAGRMYIRKRALLSAVLTAILAASLFFGTGEMDGLVLCLGHCGHVEVEEFSHTSCNETCTSVGTPQPGETPGEPHDHCTDLPLGGQRAAMPRGSSVQNLPRPHSVIAVAVGDSAPPCAGDFLEGPIGWLPLPPPHLPALRTVVLLT